VGFQPAPVPSGFSAAVEEGDTTWSAELAIDDSLLGGFVGQKSSAGLTVYCAHSPPLNCRSKIN
ncbi:MAG: hypothetical protein O7A06_10070, partial [Acidobacteria bacterium]|nr:hypothetical protein [Acidobacteriota bacterium]